ncbi:MAG: PmoA family protein [Verrucomicrobiae bacterium]|nr:PmoA family protein [Verrucomicrobiae bacterium]MCP5521719.1 PmoA family protein [Verrucomicrobiales bacterium]
MKRFTIFTFLGLVWLPLATAAETPLTTEIVPDSDWIVRWEGKPLCVYHFGSDKKKPYIRELHTLQGQNILRDSPEDHLHHHALMYGIRVNGVNFWEEVGGYGLEKPVETLGEQGGVDRRGTPRAMFRQRLTWVGAEPGAKPLVNELRTLTLTVDATAREVALVWRSRFEPAAGVDRVRLEGANYHGLGMRFLKELDPLAVHWVGGEKPDLSNSRQDVRAARWGAVIFDQPEHPATVVLAGSPLNRGAPSHFFSMLTPFAYLSATQNLDQAPLEYAAGESWTLTHLVLLYPEPKSPEAIDQRVGTWVDSQNRRSRIRPAQTN